MPTLLFCVDHLFEQTSDGTVYTTGGKLPYAKWEEYLEFFDRVMVFSRGRSAPDDHVPNMARSSGPGLTFHLQDSRRGVRRLTSLGSQRAQLARAMEDADAVIGRIPSEIGIAGCKLAARAGKPYLVEIVACPWDALWNHGSLAAKAYAPVMTQRTRSVARDAALVHYVTREFLQRRYPTKAPYICASNVMLPEVGPDLVANRLDRLRAWRSGERPVALGTIGALFTSLKGIDLAVEALARLRQTAPPFVYRVLGEGDPARLRALAERLGVADCVKFDGVLPGAREVAGWLDGVDVYLQPSYQEGLPRALIEALNRACLAIGSTVGGIPELLPPARIHPRGKADQLGQCIAALLASDDAVVEAETRHNFEVAQRYSYTRSLAEKRRAYRALRDWVDRGGPPEIAAAGE